MNADKIIERLEKLRGDARQSEERDMYGDMYEPGAMIVDLTDLNAAIADIRKLLAEEPPFSYTDACFLSRVYNDAVRVPPDNWINEWLKYQIATRKPEAADGAK